jgi:1-acyl-sn-glycerol-3-phosphate acyltransferase
MPKPVVVQTEESHEQRLLSLIAALVAELRPRGTPAGVIDLDSALDRDLGFDSLSRVELILRIEREFGVKLPERLLGEAESPRDILRSLRTAPGRRAVVTPLRPRAPAAETAGYPAAATTLVEALQWHVERQPGRQHVVLYGEAAEPVELSYRALHARALTLAAGLQDRGLAPGSAVAIMLPTGLDYLGLFFAVLLAGGIPVPIYPPARASQLEEHLRRHAGILGNARAALLVTVDRARTVARLLMEQVDTLREVVTCAGLESGGRLHPVALRSDDIAFLQYTSGSTGAPKGVVLTHADLLANIRAMGAAIRVRPGDIFASWLPLYHDMGLIGAWLGSLYFAMPLVLMSPLAFLARPGRWLRTIHRHRATLSAAPNFAYELCLNKVTEEELDGLDLSSWRYAFNGAEPVSPQTVRRFCQRFARCGFRPGAMAPVYGLAEAAVGLAFPPPGRAVVIDRIRRDALLSRGEAQPAGTRDSDALEVVACGQPLPGYQIRVVERGRELPERREGRIQFRGPSATSGYYRNPAASRALFDGDWLETGDRGFIADGDIFITSRTKDVIIRAGRNIYPYEVEAAVGKLPGIRKGCVAMFGGVEPRTGTERVVVVAETHESEAQARASLRQQAMATATRIIGMPPDEIVLAPPQSVLKTSSGKIRRAAIREQYEAGRLGRGPRAVWWQFARLAMASAGPRWRRTLRWLRDVGYAIRAYAAFCLLVPPAWLAVVLLPTERLRWAALRHGARLLLRLGGVPLTVTGRDRVPRDRAQVFVANHSSYLDGVALVAALPVNPAFVAKGELQRRFVPRLFLQRIGARFVERFDWRQGAEDARGTVEVLRAGRSLFFFPEGTLTRAPGLLPFHLGAFMAASEAGAPVTPVVLRGTRSILRSGSRFPHRGALRLEFGEPLPAGGAGWDAAMTLSRTVRERMLENLGEPDLAAERTPL